MASDPTLEFIDRLRDESQWSIRRGVPIFMAHTETFPEQRLKSGQLVPARTNVVTDADLESIAANMRLAEAGGTFCALQIGHINPDPQADETQQPPVGGVYRNPRVGRYGPQQRLAILADEYLLRRWEPVRSNYPHRSAEYYAGRKTIKAVAILTRPPALDMGMVGFKHGEFPFLYSGADMADAAMGPANGAMPEKKGDEEFTPEQKSLYEGLRRYMCKTYGLDESWPGAAKPVAPDPTKSAVPTPDPVEDKKVSPMQGKELAAIYQQQIAALNAKIEGVQLEREHERCQAMLYQLHAEGFRLADEDKADELKVLSGKPNGDRAAYLSRLRKRYEYTKVPGTAGGVQLYQGHYEGGTPDDNDPTAKPWYHDAAMQYMLAKPGMGYDTACAYVQSTQRK